MSPMSPLPPRVIVKSSLALTRAQEDLLCRQFMERFHTARREMGYLGQGQAYGGLLLRWQEYTRMYEGDFSHRALQDELFEQFNTSDNVPQRAIRVFKAKANAKLLNTQPWFTVGQARRGAEDPRIKLVDEYYQELLEEAEAREALHQGIEACGIRGNQIVKITRRLDQVHSRRESRILMIGGHVLRDTAGRPITEEDEWEDDPQMYGRRVLQRDRRILLEGEPEWSQERFSLPVTKTTRRGLDVVCKPWQDFYCSPQARSIHEADCFDVYDLDVDDLLSRMHGGGGQLSDEAELWLNKVRREDGRAKTDSGLPQVNREEREEDKDARPRVQIAEGWIKLDADGDNRCEELFVAMDVTNETPVFYDYMEEASPTGRKPYANLRLIPLEERWTGIGFYQLLENQHAFIDRQRNRIDARSGLSGNIKWQKAGAVRETKFGVPLRFNDPRFYTIEPEFQGGDAFGVFSLPPMAEQCWQLLESERQNAQLLSGTLTPQDQDFSNSPGGDTLGGLELMAKESEILNDDSLQGLIRGVRDVLDQGARVTLTPEGYDHGKCVDVLGEEDAQEVATWVQEGHGRNLGRRIKLLLTKSRSLQQLKSNMQALEVLGRWDQLQPEQQLRYFDIYQDILNSLEVQSPDKALGDPRERLAQEEEAAAMQAQEEEAAAMQAQAQEAAAMQAQAQGDEGAGQGEAQSEGEMPDEGQGGMQMAGGGAGAGMGAMGAMPMQMPPGAPGVAMAG